MPDLQRNHLHKLEYEQIILRGLIDCAIMIDDADMPDSLHLRNVVAALHSAMSDTAARSEVIIDNLHKLMPERRVS